MFQSKDTDDLLSSASRSTFYPVQMLKKQMTLAESSAYYQMLAS